ncbi:hypothetical protein FQZ97_810990 [compost metagenome]
MALADVHLRGGGAVHHALGHRGGARGAGADRAGADAAGAAAGGGGHRAAVLVAGRAGAAGVHHQRCAAGDHAGRRAGHRGVLEPGGGAAGGGHGELERGAARRGAGPGARRQPGQRPAGGADHGALGRVGAAGDGGQPAVQGAGRGAGHAFCRPVDSLRAAAAAEPDAWRGAVPPGVQRRDQRRLHRSHAVGRQAGDAHAARAAAAGGHEPAASPRSFGAVDAFARHFERGARGAAPGGHRGDDADRHARRDPQQRPAAGAGAAAARRHGGRAVLGDQVLHDAHLARGAGRRGKPALDGHHQLHDQHGADRGHHRAGDHRYRGQEDQAAAQLLGSGDGGDRRVAPAAGCQSAVEHECVLERQCS